MINQQKADTDIISLSNGFKFIHLPYKGEVEYFGVSVNAGSRDEMTDHQGLAHFVEHTIFKGTERRRSWHILNRMESVGGELNAYTTKEETVVYSIFPYGNLERAIDLISDILVNSNFPKTELRKEKSVVEEEILSYLDSPADDIFDKFDEEIFSGSSLSHNILGSIDTLDRIDSELCQWWLNTKLLGAKSVIFYMGKSAPKGVLKKVEKYFGRIQKHHSESIRQVPKENTVFNKTVTYQSLHQCHNIFGIRIPGLKSSIRPAYALISNILGGPGMNSALNLEMREKRGLVYTVDASLVSYTDCGLMTIYFGCDPREENKSKDIFRRTLDELASEGLSSVKLSKAKRQFVGQMTLSYENHEQNVLSAARSVLHKDCIYTFQDNIDLINAITLDEINEILSSMKSDSFSCLTLRGDKP